MTRTVPLVPTEGASRPGLDVHYLRRDDSDHRLAGHRAARSRGAGFLGVKLIGTVSGRGKT